MAQRIRIRLKAFDHGVLDQAAADIVRTAEKTAKSRPDCVNHIVPAAAAKAPMSTPRRTMVGWPAMA